MKSNKHQHVMRVCPLLCCGTITFANDLIPFLSTYCVLSTTFPSVSCFRVSGCTRLPQVGGFHLSTRLPHRGELDFVHKNRSSSLRSAEDLLEDRLELPRGLVLGMTLDGFRFYSSQLGTTFIATARHSTCSHPEMTQHVGTSTQIRTTRYNH